MAKRTRNTDQNYVPRYWGFQRNPAYKPVHTVVGVGTVTVEGVNAALKLHVHINENGFFSARLPFPTRYPETPLRRTGNIVDIQGSFQGAGGPSSYTKGYPVQAFYDMRKMLQVHRSAPVLFISSFYGIPPSCRAVLLPSEAAAFRGIARRCMCAVLRTLSKHLPVREALIMLEASGQVDTGQKPSNAELTPRHMRAMLRRMLVEYVRRDNKTNLGATASKIRSGAQNAREAMATHHQREREQKGLERMYTRAFGLQALSRGLSGTLMAGWCVTALQRCRNAPAR